MLKRLYHSLKEVVAKKNKEVILYPFFFALYPVLHLFSKNHEQYAPDVILLPAAVLLLSSALLLILLRTPLKEYHRTAALLFLFQVWFFSYAAFRSLIVFDIMGIKPYRHQNLMVFWLVLLLILVTLFFRVKINFRKITPILNITCLCLVLFALFPLTHDFTDKMTTRLQEKGAEPVHGTPANPARGTDDLPDIYYIILDSYTGAKALKDYLNFDNSPFIDRLRKKGFFVADESHSNYGWTRYSISSTLNMRYLPMEPDKSTPGSFRFSGDLDTTKLISDNEVLKHLTLKGYRYIDLSIWRRLASKMVGQQEFQQNPYYNFYNTDFYIELIKMTFLAKPLAENYLEGKIKREEITRKFDLLETIPRIKGPTFTYAHFLVPHPGYVFDRDGNDVTLSSKFMQFDEKELYLNQLMYTNTRVEKTIDAILAKPGQPPIIIVQGDHGAWELGKDINENMQMRMSILNAYYLPKGGAEKLYPSITPVNTFRIVFNRYFGGTYPLLADKSYYSGTPNSPLTTLN